MQKKTLNGKSTAKAGSSQSAPSASHPTTTEVPVAAKGKRAVQTVRGFRDILPEEQPYWQHLATRAVAIAESYGFQPISIPVVEHTSLFERGVGSSTDIVEKEMFDFVDKSGESLTLRPEPTAGMVRAYIQHGLINQPQPIKWYFTGSLFRYQRPQYGRQREFHQWGAEVIGDGHPVTDALLLVMASTLFRDLGVAIALQVNTVGDTTCRPVYRKALVEYYRRHKKELCEDCQRRLTKNPLRLLDCKEDGCRALKADAPQFVDHLCEPCRDHFVKMLEYLDELDVPYVLNPHLVRGIDYYTRTVFEVWGSDDVEGKTALAGGGRYDDLVAELGGRPTPAAGLGVGMEATILKMKEQAVPLPAAKRPEVYIAQLGEPARRKALRLFEELRQSGIAVTANFSKDGLKAQMESAVRLGVRYAVIIGQKEIVDNTVIVRDMEAGIQETFDFKKIITVLQRKVAEEAPIVMTNSNGPANEPSSEVLGVE